MKKFFLIIATIVCNIAMSATTILYEKITDASVLKDGDNVILVYEEGKLASAGISSTGKYLDAVEITINTDGYVEMDKEQADNSDLTLLASGTSWKVKKGNKYMRTKDVGNLNFDTSAGGTSYTYTWNISVNNGDVVFASTNAAYGEFRCVPGNNPYFRTYTSGWGMAVQLYRRGDGQDIHVESISVSPQNVNLLEGKEITLTATVLPENTDYPNVVWSSSDESVATVSETGVVTAISEGTAIISATSDGVSGTCTVTVKTPEENVLTVVTDLSQIENGARVAFANARYDKVMGAYSSGNYIHTVAGEFNQERTTLTVSEEGIYTVTIDENGYLFMDYAGMYLSTYATKRLVSDAAPFYWTVEVNEGKTIVTPASNSSWGHIQYNNSASCYNVYTSQQEEVVMYSDYNSVPTDLEQITNNEQAANKNQGKVRKVFENGQIYIILSDGRKINTVGARVR